MDKLNNLMYLGVAPEYREQVYSLLLDLPKLHEETRNKIFEEYKKDLKSPHQIYSFFANKLFDDNPKRNIIFSLIDNDSNFLSSLENSSLEEINKVKKIAKAFFIWSELKLGLEDKNVCNEKKKCKGNLVCYQHRCMDILLAKEMQKPKNMMN